MFMSRRVGVAVSGVVLLVFGVVVLKSGSFIGGDLRWLAPLRVGAGVYFLMGAVGALLNSLAPEVVNYGVLAGARAAAGTSSRKPGTRLAERLRFIRPEVTERDIAHLGAGLRIYVRAARLVLGSRTAGQILLSAPVAGPVEMWWRPGVGALEKLASPYQADLVDVAIPWASRVFLGYKAAVRLKAGDWDSVCHVPTKDAVLLRHVAAASRLVPPAEQSSVVGSSGPVGAAPAPYPVVPVPLVSAYVPPAMPGTPPPYPPQMAAVQAMPPVYANQPVAMPGPVCWGAPQATPVRRRTGLLIVSVVLATLWGLIALIGTIAIATDNTAGAAEWVVVAATWIIDALLALPALMISRRGSR
ncbi:MAG: hypothetical protein JWN00_727 [Actinomycetia bacterium]|nr:hypothetical protein [Actinomycetes bacterium]